MVLADFSYLLAWIDFWYSLLIILIRKFHGCIGAVLMVVNLIFIKSGVGLLGCEHHRRYCYLTPPSIEGFIRGFASLDWWSVHRRLALLPPFLQHRLPCLDSVMAQHPPLDLEHWLLWWISAVSTHWHPLSMRWTCIWLELTNQLQLIVYQLAFTTRLFRVVLWIGAVARHVAGLIKYLC